MAVEIYGSVIMPMEQRTSQQASVRIVSGMDATYGSGLDIKIFAGDIELGLSLRPEDILRLHHEWGNALKHAVGEKQSEAIISDAKF